MYGKVCECQYSTSLWICIDISRSVRLSVLLKLLMASHSLRSLLSKVADPHISTLLSSLAALIMPFYPSSKLVASFTQLERPTCIWRRLGQSAMLRNGWLTHVFLENLAPKSRQNPAWCRRMVSCSHQSTLLSTLHNLPNNFWTVLPIIGFGTEKSHTSLHRQQFEEFSLSLFKMSRVALISDCPFSNN